MPKKTTITESLRQAVRDSGQPLTAIARATGIDLANLSRFVRGQRFLAAENLDRLAEHLALDLVPRQRIGGKVRRGAARILLVGVLATGQCDPAIAGDAFRALVNVGHSEPEARTLLEQVLTTGRQFQTAGDVLSAIFRSS